MTCLHMPKRSDFRNLTWWIFNTSRIRTVHSPLLFFLYNPPTGRNNVKKGQKQGEKENQRMEIQSLFLVTLDNYALKRIVPDSRETGSLSFRKDPSTYMLAAYLRSKGEETNSSTLFSEFLLNPIPLFQYVVVHSKLNFLYSTCCILCLGLIENCFICLFLSILSSLLDNELQNPLSETLRKWAEITKEVEIWKDTKMRHKSFIGCIWGG